MRIPAWPRRGWTLAVTLSLLVMLGATAEQSPRKVKVKEGTLVPMRLKASISSETCEQDQFLDLEVVQDVKVEGATVVKAGAPARGQVDTCSKTGIAGTAGKLRLVIVSVKAVDDQNIPVRTTASRVGEEKTMTAVGGAMICLPLILVKGEPSSYAAGSEFQTFTAGDKEIEVE